MTNDIIAPENLVYKKPDLMNDNVLTELFTNWWLR